MKDFEKAAQELYEWQRKDYTYMFPRAMALWVEWELLPEENKANWRAEVRRQAEREAEMREENNAYRRILELTEGETPDSVVISEAKYAKLRIPLNKLNVVLPWPSAKRFLNQGFRDKVPTLIAWSKSWVVISCEYDSSFWYEAVPRNPVDWQPKTYGG